MNPRKTILFYTAGAIAVVAISGLTYFFIQKYTLSRTPLEIKQNIDNETNATTTKEIDQLKKEVEKLKNKQAQSQAQNSYLLPTTQPKKDNTTIGNLDINSFLTAVGQLNCFSPNNSETSSGSGFLWKENNNFLIFTNRHVFEGKKSCFFTINQTPNDLKRWGIYYLKDVSTYYRWNSETDFGFFYLTNDLKSIGDNQDSANVEDLNYSISSLPLCSAKANQGAKVYIIGYPAYGNNGLISTRIVTEGIISGYKPFFINNSSSFSNYYVSNKTDSGNSGGAALSIEDNHFCLLGITTWLSLGNYETQGIVQNIRNIFLKDNGVPIKNPFEGLFDK